MAPDIWLSAGNPWEIYRPELAYRIGFYGEVKDGKWTPAEAVRITMSSLPSAVSDQVVDS